jgi:hypothetical protein
MLWWLIFQELTLVKVLLPTKGIFEVTGRESKNSALGIGKFMISRCLLASFWKNEYLMLIKNLKVGFTV